MAHAINAAKARLKKNQLAIGIGVRLVRNVDIIKVMKAAGFANYEIKDFGRDYFVKIDLQ